MNAKLRRKNLFGIRFRKAKLLRSALTHPSSSVYPYENEALEFQRLEFFGDSILNFAVCKKLFKEFPELDEGNMSRLRSLLVSKKILSKIARRLKLRRYIKLGKGVKSQVTSARTKVLSDCLEAFLGALYLDQGMHRTERFIGKIYSDMFDLKKLKRLGINPKNTLQEFAQKTLGILPRYRTNPAKKGFTSEVSLPRKGKASGEGRTKREAEERAARALIKQLRIRSVH